MIVIDPEEDDPLIQLTGRDANEMRAKGGRLAVAQALGSVGLNEIAVEMSLPPDIDPESELLLPSELTRLRSSREERVARATERVRARNLDLFTHSGRRYEGRVAEFDLPRTQLPYRKVRIRQGVTPEIIQELASSETLLDYKIDDLLLRYTALARISVEAAQDYTTLVYGDVLYSEIEWIR